MEKKILIVEDESLIAYDLKLILTRAGYKVCGIADSVKEALEIIEEELPDLVLLDIFLKGPLNGIDLAKKLTDKNIAFVYLSANFQESILEKARETQPYGFMLKPFREKELLITLDVAFYRHQNSIESKLRQEQLLETVFKNIVNEPGTWEQKLLKIAVNLQPYIPFDYLTVISYHTGQQFNNGISFLRTGFNEYQVISTASLADMAGLTGDELKALQQKSPPSTQIEFFNAAGLKAMLNHYPVKKIIVNNLKQQSFLNLPLLVSGGLIVSFSFYSRKDNCYSPDHLNLISRLQRSLANAIAIIIPEEQLNTSLRKIEPHETEQVNGNNKTAAFTGIIAKSHQMLTILDHVSIVAPLDTSVLILGESGTGKEQIAKSIHQLSLRKHKPLVVINCAALPASLIESELFGFEKGAFTGAIEKRIGKFEMADQGTIFLDEIGEMPAELQVKLLRVLQEQEIERIGGRGIIKINVRIIAATNRNLEKEVEEGRFRLDLYYRLCVFPVSIPPLRERKEDIPLLVQHFINKFALKISKRITGLSTDALNQLLAYTWPGNVRELEHLIERSILLTDGNIIKEVQLPRFNSLMMVNDATIALDDAVIKTIDENARDHIVNVLKSCNGKINGENGAAEILGLKPSTLHSKLKKLGIKRNDRY
ncbi:sigma 54-interacting transcriptional regulator [Mucilaginibacter polytrichastri]|uniref:Hydrogenase-4 transcriptional activator n=1 Tax=Mucilaginibacter polytrichastri TaxID=1302689 RepID=A0A1Q5ZW94_9SPHI|nr:sigma 54-interacting transcriptional regulator [Mucilaginibacter polytrichastri]OKS86016.1 Hydrogenase-4 transcriptional activator [Mucilaginibacter polytrichastri]SFS59661.1 Transcriptional regulator containing GAF, AAA-type ATPase, and DNA-binding Fis domains [Mucilaginibacter polytrichastri]